MGIYDGVSLGNIGRVATGNEPKPVEKNNKSFLNTIGDILTSRGGNDLRKAYVENALIRPSAGVIADTTSDALAEREYAEEHGGMYPASPEELSAYKSYKANTPSAGVLDTPQVTASQAAQEEQSKLQNDMGELQQSQADLASRGYTEVPDANSDPAGHMAARNMNMSRGVGGAYGLETPRMPTPPTKNQVQEMELNKVGQESAFNMNKIPEWYNSQSFNMGLITFGLNLLSGNDLATSFAAAGQAFGDMYGQEQRSYWADDLIQQGYTPTEVEEWMRTGKSDVLTDPAEKQSRLIQQRLQLQNLDNALYEGSPEMRQYQLDRMGRKDQLQEMQTLNSIRNSNAQLDLAQQRMAMEQRKYQQELESSPEWGITNPEARMVLQQGKKFTDDSNLKRSRMAVAAEAAQKAKQLLAAGDTAGAAAAYDQFEESYGKAMQGGLGKINREDATDIAGPRDFLSQGINKIVRGYRGAPTAGEIDRAISSAQRGIETEHEVINQNFNSMYNNLASYIGPERAAAQVKFQATGAGIGDWQPVANKSNVKFSR